MGRLKRESSSFSAGSQDSARSIAIAPDGKLILAGYSESGVRSYFALTRYSADGILDSTFDNDGKVTTDISDQGQVNDIVIQPDGKIVVAGYSHNGANYDFTVIRCLADSVTDKSNTASQDASWVNSTIAAISSEVLKPAHQVSGVIKWPTHSADLRLLNSSGAPIFTSFASADNVATTPADSRNANELDDNSFVEIQEPARTRDVPSTTLPSAWWPKIAHATQTVFSLSTSFSEQTPEVMKWSANLKQSTTLWTPDRKVLPNYNGYAISPNEGFLSVVVEKSDGQQGLPGFELLIWDLRRDRATGRQACEFPYGLSFSPNSDIVVLLTNGFLTVINASTGDENYKVPCANIQDFAFSPDSTEIAVVSEDRTLRRLRMKDGSEIASVEAHEIAARGVAYSSDGRTLGTVGMDGYFRCWRVEVMEATMALPLGTPLLQLRFSPTAVPQQLLTPKAASSC